MCRARHFHIERIDPVLCMNALALGQQTNAVVRPPKLNFSLHLKHGVTDSVFGKSDLVFIVCSSNSWLAAALKSVMSCCRTLHQRELRQNWRFVNDN